MKENTNGAMCRFTESTRLLSINRIIYKSKTPKVINHDKGGKFLGSMRKEQVCDEYIAIADEMLAINKIPRLKDDINRLDVLQSRRELAQLKGSE
ncbi:hypothetical protein FKG94_11240 [Exilibacterium tricleocarpae]|uniref:Uncharacterized protein n=1 Tax=Exilibacterium tricleocarpae TaxID=2591008 RepID=A0A545TQD6_9GAMM|nr:hypothetical protein [Exilibacterium tricleocarpae]TQV79436.1 hypothetical protein FKG94_11240 [Exilibacterium tricleocarpae]